MNEQSILHIDATPNASYPLRILITYRALCDSRYASTTDTNKDGPSAFIQMMNEMQEKRAVLLDRAICVLLKDLKGSRT